MLDRERMLQWQREREEADKVFRERESKANRRYRIIELVLVIMTVAVVLLAAFIERSGQPTINNIIQTSPSTSDTEGSQP